MANSAKSFYITGGTLPHGASSYIERSGDSSLIAGLKARQFCYILTSRQMGKSSLMVRAVARLREEGVICAVVDLTSIGQNLDPERWYGGILSRIAEQLGMEDALEDFWFGNPGVSPLLRLMRALSEVVLRQRHEEIVIFIDEIDMVRSLPFSADEFFAAIRSCYNRRTEDAEFERLTFCLLGVASPPDLVRDTRMTPFNIGIRIDLTDFTLEEAYPLTGGMHSVHARKLLGRVLYWTGGHPYLTQRLCQAIEADAKVSQLRDVDRLCHELFFSGTARERDDNLLFVRDRILRCESDSGVLLDAYMRALAGPPIRDDESSPIVSALHLVGIVRQERGLLRPRNRIYASVFNRSWVLENMPTDEVSRQRTARIHGAVRVATFSVILLVAMGAWIAYEFLHRKTEKSASEEHLKRTLPPGTDLGSHLRIGAVGTVGDGRQTDKWLDSVSRNGVEERTYLAGNIVKDPLAIGDDGTVCFDS